MARGVMKVLLCVVMLSLYDAFAAPCVSVLFAGMFAQWTLLTIVSAACLAVVLHRDSCNPEEART